jgi:hypothetical protein
VKRWSVTSKLIGINTVTPNLIFAQKRKEKPRGIVIHEEDENKI